MPESQNGNSGFEYSKRHHRQKVTVSSEEELGDMHLSTENYSVALEYYEKALQKIHLNPHPTDLLRIYRKISDCYSQKGLLREAMTFLQSAESHCDEGDDHGKGTIASRKGIILYEHGELEKALHEACAAYRLLRHSDDHREVANAQILMAICYFRLGQNDEAEQFYNDALASYRRVDDAVGETDVLNNLGVFHKNACRFGRALQYLKRALEICEKLGLTHHKVRVMLNMGITYLKARDFPQAMSAFSLARKMARSTGDDLKYCRATLMLSVAETKMGDCGSAEKHLLEARVLAEQRGYGREIALADEFLGDCMVVRGDYDGALQNYSGALAAAKKIAPEGDIIAEVLRRETEVFVAKRNPQEAIAVSAKALEIAAKCGERHEIGYVQRAVGLAHAMAGDAAASEQSLQASIGTFRETNNVYEAFRSAVILSEHYVDTGNHQLLFRARKLLEEALSYFENAEEPLDLATSHLLMARIQRELKNRDECLLHMYEAQRIAEDLHDRNLLRRLQRFRRSVEDEVAVDLQAPAAASENSPELTGIFSRNPHLRAILDHMLRDLMGKMSAGHAFVTLAGGSNGHRKVVTLARRGISDQLSRELTEWFLSREDADASASALYTDIAHDKRAVGIREILPAREAPVYFHPLCRDQEPFGLLFFQAEEKSDEPPRLGQTLDVAATYAGFIDYMIRGFLGGDSVEAPEKAKSRPGDFKNVITRNDRMLRVLGLAEKVAQSDSTVLLMGETGTGKGLIAQAIHSMSPRRDKKLVHVNCAAIPDTLLESELFGHARGSFTGAVGDKKGLIAEADGGTVFLDEIGKTSFALQGKLLQFLDSKKVRPVGSNEFVSVDVRLIFASKGDLLTMCREGRMLEDFYYRVNDFPITIPPLRERIEDIQLLAEYYLKSTSEALGKPVRGFSDDALALLTGYEWPGNVRELEKIVKRAVILSDADGLITADKISFDDGGACDSATRLFRMSMPDRVKDLEKRIISESLIRNGWNRSTAAGELGISYPTLLKKIREYKLTAGF